jgi:hypothetical protein
MWKRGQRRQILPTILAAQTESVTVCPDAEARTGDSQNVERSESLGQIPSRRTRTVPPELPRGSGDAALASPAVAPAFGKSPCL